MRDDLQLARAHVQKGRQLIQEQKARIAHMRAIGKDTGLSEDLLKTYEDTLSIFEADLQRLEREASSVRSISRPDQGEA